MTFTLLLDFIFALLPVLLMLLAALITYTSSLRLSLQQHWKTFIVLAYTALISAVIALGFQLYIYYVNSPHAFDRFWLAPNLFGAWVSLLVQLLGTAIAVFSSKHLQGEPRQPVYIAALAGVLGFVHLLLLANHWLVLIVAWALIGWAMHFLLCFYKDRPFALLAAHKKRVADRITDVLLIVAALTASWQVGDGNLTTLWHYLDTHETSPLLQISAVCLALAVILRTALLPVHGWLIQVMEAPTPVSALLHAGVVNLSGYVLVLFAPLLLTTPLASWLLVIFGLASAVLGGIVMLTRVSIKVHLAWSTLGQMGFMLLECGLGLYTLAALHLIGHSLYKAHSFLSASGQVRRTRLDLLLQRPSNSLNSLLFSPVLAFMLIVFADYLLGAEEWPWWWMGVLALAWAPLLWLPNKSATLPSLLYNRLIALGLVTGLTLAAVLASYLPLGASWHPSTTAGWFAFAGMIAMYVCYIAIQRWPHKLVALRHWIYAGFYLDEIYTIWALKLWPTDWANTKRIKTGPVVLMTHPISSLKASTHKAELP